MTTPITPASQVPLYAPDYDATFTVAVRRFYARALRFKGRSSRREYWWAFLFQALLGFVVGIVTGFIDGAAGTTVATGVIAPLVILAALFLPNLSLTWRRLHDAGLAGPWYFLSFIPLIGSIAILVMCAMATSANQNPKWEDPEAGNIV